MFRKTPQEKIDFDVPKAQQRLLTLLQPLTEVEAEEVKEANKLIDELVAVKASLDLQIYFGYTFLMMASLEGYAKIVAKLIAAGDYLGFTALRLASMMDYRKKY